MSNKLLPSLRLLFVLSNNDSKVKLVAAAEKLWSRLEIVASYETAYTPDGARAKFEVGKFDVLLCHQDFESTWGEGENLIREFKNQDNDIITILMTIDNPRTTKGIDRQIRTANYVEIFLGHLHEIASDKAFATAEA